jgi:hypothetical protein
MTDKGLNWLRSIRDNRCVVCGSPFRAFRFNRNVCNAHLPLARPTR